MMAAALYHTLKSALDSRMRQGMRRLIANASMRCAEVERNRCIDYQLYTIHLVEVRTQTKLSLNQQQSSSVFNRYGSKYSKIDGYMAVQEEDCERTDSMASWG